ncbi:MAG: DUF2332 domain-containing protein [Flavisolibacter sp.]
MERHLIHTAHALGGAFERFAENECKGHSSLYYHLSKQIAREEELLQLCSFVREGQPVPNAFLAAVHFFVLKNKNSFLARYYPSITGQETDTIPFEVFKSFVQQNQQGIVNLLRHRIVQSNVLTRCNYLFPVFSTILFQANKPATIIDMGCSAGLNLNFDRYEYYYDGKKLYGDSPVKLHCQIKEGKLPVLRPFTKPIRKIGIDQHLMDWGQQDELFWSQALNWPDQRERFIQLEEALKAPNHSEITLIQGSTIADFKTAIEAVDPGETLVLFATHVLYQFAPDLLAQFHDLLDETGQKRDFFFISAEATGAVQQRYHLDHTALVLTTYQNGVKNERLLAETNGHGNWVKWKECL